MQFEEKSYFPDLNYRRMFLEEVDISRELKKLQIRLLLLLFITGLCIYRLQTDLILSVTIDLC